MKVKKGWLAIQVGLEEEDGGIQKFVIPISYLYHPLLQKLLDKAHDIYGYHVDGPLKLPCSVDDFLHIRWRIEKEPNRSHHHHHHKNNHNHHHHQYFSSSLSFHSC
ncbi:hypothetical protein AABB24_010180 [Solanum stoloniferum]|uniref:SAUR family protein n=1 Tax=Solanum stoloniferum TaxID=62892 RepID=A0ABD2ULP8_9SOLN